MEDRPVKQRLRERVKSMAREDSSLGESLRDARRARKVTQAELAAALGTSQEFISMVESGRKAVPEALVPLIRQFIASGNLPAR